LEVEILVSRFLSRFTILGKKFFHTKKYIESTIARIAIIIDTKLLTRLQNSGVAR